MGHTVFEIDVRLLGIEPPIWRTIELAGNSTLEQLHFAIQVAMGWTNSHLHQLAIRGVTYGMVEIDERENVEDERRFKLQDVAKQGDKLVYTYDFGDNWEHAISIKRVRTVAKAPSPRCTAGARACPPDDCGGPGGYAELVTALANPRDKRHAEMVQWSGGFEPELFALPAAGRELRRDIKQLDALAARDDDDDDEIVALPNALVEAALSLDPIRRAALVALLAGSLADEVTRLHAKPAGKHRRGRS